MTDREAMKLCINLHCRTVVMLLDSIDRADTPQQKADRLAIARDAVLEFKHDFGGAFPTNGQETTVR